MGEHANNENNNVETPRYNEEDPSADLYAEPYPPALTPRLRLVTLNDHANDASYGAGAANDEMGAEPSLPVGTPSPSPPFEPPASWAAIETAHTERIANELASDTRLAREREIRILKRSLRYRSSVINAAKANTNGSERCILPKPWHMEGLGGDLVRHPYMLERYLHQEKEIRDMLRDLMVDVERQDISNDNPQATIDINYLKEQMDLRRRSSEARETETLIGNLLTIKLDQVISDIMNNVYKSPGTPPISDIPAGVLRVIKRDKELSDQLATLIEAEREAFPGLFEEEMSLESLEKPYLLSRKASPEQSSPPPPSTIDGLAGSLSPGILEVLVAELWSRPQNPDIYSNPIIYMSRIPPTAQEQRPEELADEQTPSPPQQQTTVPEAPPRPQAPDQSHLVRGSPPGDDGRGTGSRPHTQTTVTTSRLAHGASNLASAQPSTPPAQHIRVSTLRVISPDTAPSTAPDSNTTQTSVHKASSATPTLAISAAASESNMANAPNTPNVPRTPAPTPRSMNPNQAQGPTPTRLMQRLQLESSRSDEGVVHQVRFADRELLPGTSMTSSIPGWGRNGLLSSRRRMLTRRTGETPGESSTSRVNDWFDREDNAARNLEASGDYWMRMSFL